MELFVYEHHAKYYETDQMKIIHHSNYIRWMEEARIALMSYLGISYADMEKSGVMSPVVSVSCKYKNMTYFDDTVDIVVKVKKYNGVKLEFEYEMRNKETKVVNAVAESAHCFLDSNYEITALQRVSPEYHEIFNNYYLYCKEA